jgi:transcriptional regulator with XRE-family HTH domain
MSPRRRRDDRPTGQATFALDAFMTALDLQRQARQLTWRQVALEIKISQSTFTRMAAGFSPDVGNLVAIAAWGGLRLDDYIRHPDGTPAPSSPPVSELIARLGADPALGERDRTILSRVVAALYAAMIGG